MTSEKLYLDYCQNFLTVECFAEYHGFTVETAQAIIREGRELNYLNKSHLKGDLCLK